LIGFMSAFMVIVASVRQRDLAQIELQARLKLADQALYRAKHGGRDQEVVALLEQAGQVAARGGGACES